MERARARTAVSRSGSNHGFSTCVVALGMLLGFGAANSASADQSIENETLKVTWNDAAGSFTVAEQPGGRVFLMDGKLDGTGSDPVVTAAKDPVFGYGQRLLVKLADGGSSELDVYQNMPFVLLRTIRKNATNAEIDLQQVCPATFTLNLGKPASGLVTLGTGGLLAPDKNPGSYLFLACAEPATREGVVAGFVSQNRGSGIVFSGVENGSVRMTARLDHGHLFVEPGKSVSLDTFAIGRFDDSRLGLEQFASAVAGAHQIKLRPKTAVYCSWYAEGPDRGGAGTEATTRELATFITEKRLKEYGLGVVQLDDWWQDGPKIDGPATHFDRVNPDGPYRNGIAPVAGFVEEKGLTFGLWWLPFGRNHMEPDYKDKQDWFVKWPDGKPLRQKSFGGTCLDTTHPGVEKHLETLGKTIRSWGAKYYKMDGLVTGAGVDHAYINDGFKEDKLGECLPLHQKGMTNIEALRHGLRTIRKGAGEDVFFSGCCAVQNMRIYAGSIGLVDSMRVGPDFNHDGEGIRSGPLRGSWVYFLNGKVWWNDPDPTKVRTSDEKCVADNSINGGVTLDQARLTSSWVSLTDQFFLISDWLPALPEERLDILRRTMATHGATARPVDYFDNNLPNTWLVTDTKSGVRRDVLGLFNFYGEPLKIGHTLERAGLDPGKTYHAFDFWSNLLLPDVNGAIRDTIAPNSCKVIALREVAGHPVLLSTSRHVSQGMIDVRDESWNATSDILSGTSSVIGGDSYEIRIAGLTDGGRQWKLMTATVSAADQAVGVTVAHAETPGLLRVTIRAAASREVKWSLKFNAQPSSASGRQSPGPSSGR